MGGVKSVSSNSESLRIIYGRRKEVNKESADEARAMFIHQIWCTPFDLMVFNPIRGKGEENEQKNIRFVCGVHPGHRMDDG